MLDIKEVAPGIMVDLRYATTNNFTGEALYPPGGRCLLAEPAARRLAAAQKKLESRGLGLKVWDCYRPVSIQWKLWNTVPDARYVADPRKGSRHNRGASVDLTLVDRDGRELPMPTAFDDFGPKAHRDYTDLPNDVIKNRAILEDVMTDAGFLGLPTEWWHFDAPEWNAFALRNEPIDSPALSRDIQQPRSATGVPASVRQLVVVTAPTWTAKEGRMRRFERRARTWVEVGSAARVVLGAAGLAWGQGRHPFPGSGPIKREGDRRAPAGLFAIGPAYGRAESPPRGTTWPYNPVDEAWVCVDDPKSSHYNQVFRPTPQTTADWATAEKMRRADGLYEWVIDIRQNADPVLKGGGSCVFFHVWRRAGAATRGCTAMPESHLRELLTWLDPASDPHLVQLPESVYRRLRPAWRLP